MKKILRITLSFFSVIIIVTTIIGCTSKEENGSESNQRQIYSPGEKRTESIEEEPDPYNTEEYGEGN